ncbi:uncharacterized protein CDAR_388461 [Caerostris darwini]|uniref:Uncharacterized protein n=1 Tax=Caerostris darwini TaxID=1538125 RepID=A0AAV4VNF4_9ARAC|nr:uncharacterized protein CDAR_388461 [Caerostris darwini]
MVSIVWLCLCIPFASAVPLYGRDGGYSGYASYVPMRNHLQNGHGEDSIDTSAGSPEISRKPLKEPTSASQEEYDEPKAYDALSYKPSYQHGYDNNNLGHDGASAPYAKATLYGQGSGGYQSQHIGLHNDKEHDYKDDYVSDPQPYEYGYALKDGYGNTQHRKESSDGHGSVKGSYGFTDEHGRYRSVQYVADKEGFRASVKTNEPGTESQNPADVHLESEQSEH